MAKRVEPIGPKDAKIMIVGESPGAQEVRQGAPFVGPAGKLLNTLLRQAGIDRDEVYITNTVKIEPPHSGKDKFFFDKGIPTKEYMDGILELVQEINEVNPNVIVPIGNYALWATTQEMGITNYRGSILECKLVAEKKVIPTVHPAWYLHTFNQWHRFALSEWDFQRIAKESKFPEIRRPRREIIINPTPEQIDDAIERFTRPELRDRWITADTEWFSPDSLAYIGFADSPQYAVCIPAISMHAYRAYKAILGSEIPKTWQNAMFDAVALDRVGIHVENVKHDTMVAFNACWGDLREKGLKIIASVLTDQPYYKEDVEFVGQDDDRGQEYCATDCCVTDEAMEKMYNEEFHITGSKRAYEISMSVMETFINAAKVGIRADVDRLHAMKQEYLDEANRLEYSVSERVGFTVNCRSTKQVAHAIYDVLGIKSEKRSTSQDVLMDLAAAMEGKPKYDEQRQLLVDIIRVRQNRNIVSRYINEKIIDRDGRIRCNWNVAGTRSGRLSTTKPWWNGVALQTMPDEARELCIADPGHTFIGWDLGQAEARVVACLTKDYELLEDMDSGVDIHVKLAASLPFGKSYDEIMELCKIEGKDNVPYRVLAKKTRHGMNYILTWHGLKRAINRDYLETNVGVDAAMAKILRNGYLEVSPGLEIWWNEVLDRLQRDGMLSNCFGRNRMFLGKKVKYDEVHREAVSFEPQSTVADLTTLCIADVDKTDWILPLTHMHDGGLIQVPTERKDEAIELVRNTMTREIIVANTPLTIPVDVKEGQNWRYMEYV